MLKSPSTQSLRSRIIMFTGILFLVLSMVIVMSILAFVFTTERESWRSRQTEAAESAAVKVADYLQRNETLLYWLDSYEFDEIIKRPTLLAAILKDNPSFMEIVFVDKDGNPIADAARNNSSLANQFTILQSEWFRTANSGEKIYTRVQTSSQNESYTIFAMPSKHGGVLAAQIQMDALWVTVSKIRFGEAGSIYIINKTGQVIAHSNPEIVLSNQNISDTTLFNSILQSPDNRWAGNSVSFNNIRVASVAVPIAQTDWIVISELPEDEAYATSRRAAFFIPIEVIFMMVAATFFSRTMLNRFFMKPLNYLRDGANQIGQGNLEYRITIPRMDELGEVMAVFNAMAADLEEQQENLQKAVAYEYESKRAYELDILLKASEATSSSLDLDTVLRTLASQLLELSGFESCFISEWEKENNLIIGRLDLSRTFWKESKRDIYSLDDFPRTKQVILTGNPIILQGDFEAEEKQWMDELKRSAAIILAIYSQEKIIGLVEMASTKTGKLFAPQVLEDSQKILFDAALWLIEPLSANDPKKIFEVEETLLKATGADVCSFSEWDQSRNCIINTAVFTNISWETGQGTRFNPDIDIWKNALYKGETSIFISPEEGLTVGNVFDGNMPMDAESIIMFPLQKGTEHIGVIELYDFNHRRQVSPEQIALLRTLADKASFSIENARLLGQTQKRLDEQTAMLHEKEVLLKEIHHRVKNNLQIISSLLNLQANQVQDAGTLRALRDSQSRVRSMALIHEKLYQSKSLAKINFGEYVQNLTTDLFRSYQRELGAIQLNIHVKEVYLDLDQAVPCGLILNELITNTLKYAFPSHRSGTIWVELDNCPDQMVGLRVADDGVGLPADLETRKTKSLGWQLVQNLVAQLDGSLEIERSTGASFRISFRP